MGLKTSFFNTTVLRKNLTRFAPAWGIFTAGCLLVIPNVVDANDPGGMLVESLSLMGFVNFCYALVCGLLLFGDLFNARLCNALHAMPLRREGWFLTHLAAGVCFALIPYGVTAVCILPMLEWNWIMAPVWLLGSMLEYLFFFSAAMLCVFCTGSRFATTVFYGLANFLAFIAAWFVEVIYGPLLTGVSVSTSWASALTPVVFFMDNYDWLSWFDKQHRYAYGIGDCWTYLLVLTVLAVAFFGLALSLYKRRKLECAGDFVAVRGLAPVFLVIYTLTMAVLLHLFGSIFVGNDDVGTFFIVGLAIGWFTGLMLLRRTVRVFRGKTVLGFAVFAAVMLISFLLTWADPLGITRWVPRVEEVTSVRLDGYGYYASGVKVTAPEEIADITDIHSQAIQENVDIGNGYGPVDTQTVQVVFRYGMENGKTVERNYHLDVDSELAQRLIPYFSDPEVILGYENWEKFLAELYQLRIDWNDDAVITGEDAVSLAQAIRADCEAGSMVQYWEFHEEAGVSTTALNVDIVVGDRHFDLTIYHDCENTMQWLRERDLIPEHYLDEKYG